MEIIGGGLAGLGLVAMGASGFVIPVAIALGITITEVITNWEQVKGYWGGITSSIKSFFSGDSKGFWDGVTDAWLNWLNSDTWVTKLQKAIIGEDKWNKAMATLKNGGSVKAVWDQIWLNLGDSANWGIVNGLGPIVDWWTNNVTDPIQSAFEGAWDSIKTTWGNVTNWFKSNIIDPIKGLFEGMNFKIKLPHFSWGTTAATGWVKKVLDALGLPASLPKLNVSWYGSGGFPTTGELFMAREAGPEMVGSVSGRTAVANNDQIVAAVSQGVAEAVARVMSAYNNSDDGNTYLVLPDGKILATLVEKQQRKTGYSLMKNPAFSG
jgi:hypothetical protein